MNNDGYKMSFTTGGLFLTESVKLAGLYVQSTNWDEVREKALEYNLLQARTISTAKRVCRELIFRLEKFSSSELNLFIEADPQDQGYLLWLAVCRYYKFIGDFAVEVLRERYITLKPDLTHEDFDSFFNKKAEWHDELDAIRPATRKKLRQVLFRILREANLLTKDYAINAAILSPRLLETLYVGEHRDMLFFPTFESTLKENKQ